MIEVKQSLKHEEGEKLNVNFGLIKKQKMFIRKKEKSAELLSNIYSSLMLDNHFPEEEET